MTFFPQLTTGNIAQYPYRKARHYRTVANETPGGSLIQYADGSSKFTTWRLGYSGLSDQERNSLEHFFTECEGRLKSFLFIDPTSNMLQYSELISNTAWHKSPLLSLSVNIPDPGGTNRATRITNSSQVVQTLYQEIEAPGAYEYCFGLQVRSSSSTEIVLGLNSEDSVADVTSPVGSVWSEVCCPAALPASATTMKAKISIEPGAIVDVFGCQLQAQRNASAYRKTINESAVCQNTYFLDDELSFTANGLNDHSCQINLISYMGATR